MSSHTPAGHPLSPLPPMPHDGEPNPAENHTRVSVSNSPTAALVSPTTALASPPLPKAKPSPSSPHTIRPPLRQLPDTLDHYMYLRYLPSTVWKFLFSYSPALQAILRSLHELDQQIVLRLCYLHQAVSERAMRLWVQPDALSSLRKSITSLLNCHILLTSDTKRSELTQYTLDPTLQTHLRNRILLGPSESSAQYIVPPSDEQAFTLSTQAPTKQALLIYSKKKWDNLLRYIVSPGGEGYNPYAMVDNLPETLFVHPVEEIPPVRPCKEVVVILMRRRLLSLDLPKTSQQGRMSREAFSWLLKDLRSQIVSLIVEFLFILDAGNLSTPAYQSENRQKILQNTSKKAADRSPSKMELEEFAFCRDESLPTKVRIEQSTIAVQEVLLLLFSLSQASVGQPFLVHTLTTIQQRFLRVAVDLGLLWMPEPPTDIYFVAPYSLLLKHDDAATQALTATLSTISMDSAIRHRDAGLPTAANTSQMSLGDHFFYPCLTEGSEKEESMKPQGGDMAAVMGDTGGDAEFFSHSYPRIAVSSMLPFSKRGSASGLEAGIVVQSNFKIYIYTASALHISVLSHLCELQARTSNLVVGLLTRESVLAAYRSGITSDQIIRFLESHAHPALYDHAVKEDRSLLPENIIVQLRMWEAEQHRLTLEPAVLFKKWQIDFLPELFQRSVRWALGKGYCLHYTSWSENAESAEFAEWMHNEKYLCVTPDAKTEMIEKIREFREAILKQRDKDADPHAT